MCVDARYGREGGEAGRRLGRRDRHQRGAARGRRRAAAAGRATIGFGVAVVCDADRVGAARWALKNLGSEVFVLDDGFQHLRLARDLNVVTLDASDRGRGRLLPVGRLREPRGGCGGPTALSSRARNLRKTSKGCARRPRD